MVYLLGGILVATLVIAFIAQSLLSPQRRTRIIFGAAAVPSIVLLMSATASGDESVSWLQIVVSLALALCVSLFVGLVGAIIGSELATLAKRLLQRQR